MTTTTTTTKAALLASKPDWAKAAITATFEVDKSDSMTDYFATSTEKVVFLAWSRSTRDLFSEMRKAAATFPETAHLATAPASAEHREKYSMGAGYYLKASSRYSTGWTVEKTGLGYGLRDIVHVPVSVPAPSDEGTVAAVAPTAPGSVTMTLNAEKNGVELRFADKPSVAVRDALKANGWRWSRFGGLWYHKDTPAARAFAVTMTAPVAA